MSNVRESSNLSIRHPHPDVADANSLTYGIVSHQDRASIIWLVSTEPLPFWGTCGMCTPYQVTKHLSIYLFLTHPSRHHMHPHLLLRQPWFDRLSTGTNPIRIFAAFPLQHLLIFHTIFLDVSWFFCKSNKRNC